MTEGATKLYAGSVGGCYGLYDLDDLTNVPNQEALAARTRLAAKANGDRRSGGFDEKTSSSDTISHRSILPVIAVV